MKISPWTRGNSEVFHLIYPKTTGTTPEKIARALEIKERFESVIIPKGS